MQTEALAGPSAGTQAEEPAEIQALIEALVNGDLRVSAFTARCLDEAAADLLAAGCLQ